MMDNTDWWRMMGDDDNGGDDGFGYNMGDQH
jgi:hypothetical protein